MCLYHNVKLTKEFKKKHSPNETIILFKLFNVSRTRLHAPFASYVYDEPTIYTKGKIRIGKMFDHQELTYHGFHCCLYEDTLNKISAWGVTLPIYCKTSDIISLGSGSKYMYDLDKIHVLVDKFEIRKCHFDRAVALFNNTDKPITNIKKEWWDDV